MPASCNYLAFISQCLVRRHGYKYHESRFFKFILECLNHSQGLIILRLPLHLVYGFADLCQNRLVTFGGNVISKPGRILTIFASLLTVAIGFNNCSPSPEHQEESLSSFNLEESVSEKVAKARPSNASPFSTDDELWVKGRILVKAGEGISEDDMIQELSRHGGKPVSKINGIDVHIVELPENANEAAIAALLAHNPKFKFAEVDRLSLPSMTANDPYFGSAWHLPKIQAPQSWDMTLGAGVIIAVIDTGVDLTHPDLVGKLVPGYNVFDNNTNPSDVQGHGTAVAGTAAAISNNAVGVTGVAWNARIMPIRIADPTTASASSSAAAAGITWAADHGARVANLSYQGFNGSSAVLSAANYMQNKNGVTVICMGNTGASNSAANSQPAIFVGATDSVDAKTSFSTYGPSIDLAAPGTGIQTTLRGGGYGGKAGTSFSAPIVAGVAALAMSVNPSLTGRQIQDILYKTSDDLGTAGWDQYFGWGRVNASRAVAAARGTTTTVVTDTTAPSTAITSPTGGAKVLGTATVNVNATDASGVSKVELYVGGVLLSTDTIAPYSFSWNTTTRADGAVTLMAKAYDTKGNVGSSSISVTVDNVPDTTTTPTPSPTPTTSVAISSLTPNQVKAGLSVDVTISGSGLLSGATVALSGGSGPTPAARVLSVSSTGTSLVVRITTKSGGTSNINARYWDVTVTNSNGRSAMKAKAFLVNP